MSAAWVPLKHLALLNPEALDESTSADFAFRYIDIAATGRGRLISAPQQMTFGQAPSRARRILRPGDTILSTVRTYLRAVWTLRADEADLIASTGFVCIRPGADIDPRYLGWLAESDVVVDEVVARSVGVSYPAINPSEVGTIKVPSPPLEEQRAIADYLDRETARIDALIATKRQMAGLLEERWQAVLEDRIQRLVRDCGPIPLKYVCREITVGIVVTPAAWYADSGVPAIRGMNLSPGSITLEDVVYLSDEGHRLHPKSQLRAGDVLVVRTGQAGTAAVVPPELEGANCIDLVIIRLQPSYEPRFLEFVLNSDWMQKHVAEHSVGTIQGHFNVGAASLVPVPQAPTDVQREVVAELSEYRSQIAETLALLGKESSLLKERRQALITAAVTGHLSAPVAA